MLRCSNIFKPEMRHQHKSTISMSISCHFHSVPYFCYVFLPPPENGRPFFPPGFSVSLILILAARVANSSGNLGQNRPRPGPPLVVEGCGGYCNFLVVYLGVSKHRGTPKWMVYDGKPYSKWMIWGYHYFWKHPF